ncbi:Predicted acetyltransferase involved in intracellular survival and related acetyltransferases [Paenibacillus uliginis N3/975]|uniref:Predicted acetyltransferase involved in intracellular survival and related acetyltransferases n=1 Tax=Paenibacillus uliginis N3/975 TaxID=1313296 RepID=A0A1X7GVP4_9BACL|nr:GNAT family N-acetyltransferase [Paenibacillus uliginis]SMF75471.1 Predicted acetyltransferase involved in intracellular survival and related acetyltransferases [Paenibacillus uliginis N3/975]
MEIYSKGTLEDAQDIIDFADYIFSKSTAPHDFASLIPKLYGEGRMTQQYHYLVKEDGKIRAMLCVLPIHFKVADIELKVGCVGTVSVHPRARGKGYMQKLLTFALDEMKAEGYDYSLLGGQRQRYEYFGYEPAGVKLDFTLTSDNVRHKYRGLDADHITFEELTEASALLDDVFDLYQKGKVSGARNKEQFSDLLRTWNAQPYVILHNGMFAGYLSLSKDSGMIFEIELTDTDLLPSVSKSLMAYKGLPDLHFTLPAYDKDKIRRLGSVCDMYKVGYQHNYNMFKYAPVIEAYMKCKALESRLQDGRFVLQIESGETVDIQVRSGEVIVEHIDGENCDVQADAILSASEATALLFSPLSSYAGFSAEDESQPNCPQGWFPLPLFTPPQDCC